jgi:hypothetical protein
MRRICQSHLSARSAYNESPRQSIGKQFWRAFPPTANMTEHLAPQPEKFSD